MIDQTQLQQERAKYGIPTQGFGAAPNTTETSTKVAALDAAWNKQTPQQSDTMANQATFKATGTESPFAVAGKVIGNTPSSAINFGKGVIDFLNPLNTAKTAAAIGTTAGEALNEGQDAGTVVKDTITGLPKAAYDVVVPQFLKHIFSGDLQKAAATIENDPVGQIAPLLMVARASAEKLGKGAEFDSAISTMAKPVTKPAAAVGSGVSNAAAGATRFLGGQMTGLSPDTIQKVVADPRAFSKTAEESMTRQSLADEVANAIKEKQGSLSETGKGYETIRTSETPIKVEPSYLDKIIKETTGLSVSSDGKLQATGAASIRTPSDVNALQTKLYDIWKPEFEKGTLTPNEFLNFRSDLAKLAKYEGGVGSSKALENLADVMRGKTNTDLRSQVQGLEELDKSFAPQVKELNDLSKGLIDKDGHLTDSAINKIANATGKGKDPILNRLEELSPGITDKIKILKAVEDIKNSREVKVGTYLRAGALGAGIVTLNPYLIVSAISSIPEVAVPLLRGLGYSKETIGKITKTLGINTAVKNVSSQGSNALKLAPGATAQENANVLESQ